MTRRGCNREDLADLQFGPGRQHLVDLRVREQIGRGLIEILLEARHVLLQHAKGVEGAVVPQGFGLRNPPQQTFQVGRMSQQHGAERSHGLSVGMALRVVDALEPRLHDVVAVPEMNDVIGKAAALARAEQCPGLSVGERALLDVVELRDLRGVDRRDEMDPLGLVEGSRPGFRRAPPDIAEFQGAGGHAFDEFVREHLE